MMAYALAGKCCLLIRPSRHRLDKSAAYRPRSKHLPFLAPKCSGAQDTAEVVGIRLLVLLRELPAQPVRIHLQFVHQKPGLVGRLARYIDPALQMAALLAQRDDRL